MARYLLLLFYLGTARAACFGKDASFNPTLVGTKYPSFSGAQAWDICRRIFTQIRPVPVYLLLVSVTRQKKSKSVRLGPYISLSIGEFF
jgi:hypothetical protein